MSKMLVKSLDEITYKTFKEAVSAIAVAPITSTAPLGYRSDDVLLYGKDGNARREGISVFNHSGSIKMLICNFNGSFIFHGGFDKSLPVNFIANELFKTYKKVKGYIQVRKEVPNG